MDHKLINDTFTLLRQHMDAQSNIEVQLEDQAMKEIMTLLDAYELAYSRKITVMACFMLIYSALRKHKELLPHDDKELSRSILDGDYLLGLYHKIAAQRKEIKLLMHLSLFNKRMQLALLKGKTSTSLFHELKAEIQTYLDKQSA